jgi:hypothetical protein
MPGRTKQLQAQQKRDALLTLYTASGQNFLGGYDIETTWGFKLLNGNEILVGFTSQDKSGVSI